ncbi:TerC family protein [Microvirga flavescens]|uniref:TerC family protein n=1 Tax=Microvirga flavescens TaxID=2249811 RepID=UPI001FE142D6|nr:TerC family protein [Microvirga flavescens]
METIRAEKVAAPMPPEFLTGDWLGRPLWMWLTFHAILAGVLAFDRLILRRGPAHEIGVRESLVFSSYYITLGLLFGGWVWIGLGAQAGKEYLTGFLLEKSLSMDNVFVMALIFRFFGIPGALQYRVLFWGILAVIVLRGLMIAVGAALVSRFGWMLDIFAAFLIFTGIKMIFTVERAYDVATNPIIGFMRRRFRITDSLHGEHFAVWLPNSATGRRALWLTPLALALVLIEISDVIFAIDSVPAIFAITTDTFIVYTSNIFAVLGLRALYFALAAMVERFRYLKYALVGILIFIGAKVFAADLLGIPKIPPGVSLAVTLGLIAAGIGFSLWKTRRDNQHRRPSRP